MSKKPLTLREVAEFIAKHGYDLTDPREQALSEEARVTAYHAIKSMANSLIFIEFDKDELRVSFNENIGNIMNNDDVSDSLPGQRYYVIHALAHALAATAREQVDDGYDLHNVMSLVLDAVTKSLNSVLGVCVDVGHISPEDIEDILDEKSSLLS